MFDVPPYLKICDLIFQARTVGNFPSKAELARALNIPKQRLTDYCSGKRKMPDKIIIALAHIARLNPAWCLCAIRATRPNNAGEHWKQIADMIKEREGIRLPRPADNDITPPVSTHSN